MKIHWSVLVLVPLVWGADAKWKPSGNDFLLSSGNLSIKVASELGRISELRWNGVNLLGVGGSLFYPAPQKDFPNTWPPPVGFTWDSPVSFKFYLNSDSTALIAKPLQPGSNTVYLPSRGYRFDPVVGQLVVTYGIKNTSTTETKKVAGWEVTRVPSGSLLFYPKGDDFRYKMSAFDTIHPVESNGIHWFQDNLTDGVDKKLFKDGKEGWLAQIRDTVLLIKSFQDIPVDSFAPQEAEIELYRQLKSSGDTANRQSSQNFIEMEQQGPYTTLQPGDSLTWTVKWYLKPVPKSIATPGNHALVDSVRSVLKQAALPVHPRLRPTRDRSGLPFVDVRGRLLSKSDRAVKAGPVGVMNVR